MRSNQNLQLLSVAMETIRIRRVTWVTHSFASRTYRTRHAPHPGFSTDLKRAYSSPVSNHSSDLPNS